jgi:hypothetical protein
MFGLLAVTQRGILFIQFALLGHFLISLRFRLRFVGLITLVSKKPKSPDKLLFWTPITEFHICPIVSVRDMKLPDI